MTKPIKWLINVWLCFLMRRQLRRYLTLHGIAYKGAIVVVLSGQNVGMSRRVAKCENETITLDSPFPNPLKPGVSFRLLSPDELEGSRWQETVDSIAMQLKGSLASGCNLSKKCYTTLTRGKIKLPFKTWTNFVRKAGG